MINICGSIGQETIIKEKGWVSECEAFSMLAYETADFSGKQQISLGIRCMKKDADVGCMINEETIGFAKLEKLAQESVTLYINPQKAKTRNYQAYWFRFW